MAGLYWPQEKPCPPQFIPVLIAVDLPVRITDDEGWPYLHCTARSGTQVFVSPTWKDEEKSLMWCEGQTAIVTREEIASSIL